MLYDGRPPPARAEVAALLSQVSVVEKRQTIIGYSRAEFGGGWGMKGSCNTRQAVMVRWFGGSCGAVGERDASDPYTGEMLDPLDVDIDHVYPLAAAWDFGAAFWTATQRTEFANDIKLNLLPTAAAVNRAKSDHTPAEWMPDGRSTALRCDYSKQYLQVAIRWELPVSAADWQALAGGCGIRGE